MIDIGIFVDSLSIGRERMTSECKGGSHPKCKHSNMVIRATTREYAHALPVDNRVAQSMSTTALRVSWTPRNIVRLEIWGFLKNVALGHFLAFLSPFSQTVGPSNKRFQQHRKTARDFSACGNAQWPVIIHRSGRW